MIARCCLRHNGCDNQYTRGKRWGCPCKCVPKELDSAGLLVKLQGKFLVPGQMLIDTQEAAERHQHYDNPQSPDRLALWPSIDGKESDERQRRKDKWHILQRLFQVI